LIDAIDDVDCAITLANEVEEDGDAGNSKGENTHFSRISNQSHQTSSRFLEMDEESDEHHGDGEDSVSILQIEPINSTLLPSSVNAINAKAPVVSDQKVGSSVNRPAASTKIKVNTAATNKIVRKTDKPVVNKITSFFKSTNPEENQPAKLKGGATKITTFFKSNTTTDTGSNNDDKASSKQAQEVMDLLTPPSSPTASRSSITSSAGTTLDPTIQQLMKIPGMKEVLKTVDLNFLKELPKEMFAEQVEELKHRARSVYISPSKHR
jgi:hypothetical protein